MAKPMLSIVIVNWNAGQYLQDCLASIFSNSGLRDEFDIWIVDNASTDGSVEWVRQHYPLVNLIVNHTNIGFAGANNQALNSCSGKYVLLLNPDTVLLPDSIAYLLEFMEAHPVVGICGPKLLNGDQTLQPSWSQFPNIWSELFGRQFRPRHPYPGKNRNEAYSVDWIGGACFLIRRQVIDQVGQLDNQYFIYSEELDWCYRARKNKWVICYLPTAQVIHLGGKSTSIVAAEMVSELYRSKLFFFYKHYGFQNAWLLAQIFQLRIMMKTIKIKTQKAIRKTYPTRQQLDELQRLNNSIKQNLEILSEQS